MTRWLIIAASLIGLALLLLYPLARAGAQEHIHGNKPIDAEVGKFYGSWMRPDARSQSCCNRLDCDATEARMDKGRWRAFSKLQNRWIDIPATKVEREREIPPGAHLCENSSGVICFGAGAGG
jgi:hypothetical protein